MSDHPKRTLPLAASITHLKHEAKALRAAFDAGDADGRDRVSAHVDPLPTELAQAQALFVVARGYGFPSWPALKRHVQRGTRTVFSDVEGVAAALADLLDDANASVAESLESAFDSDGEVLVLYLDAGRSDRLSKERVAALRGRKMIVTGSGASWLCAALDLEIGGGMGTWTQPLEVAETGLLAGERGDYSIEPLERPSSRESYILRKDRRGLAWRPIHDELRVREGAGFVEVIARLEQEDASAVVARQANYVFAGVMAPPDDWSAAYCGLFRRLVTGLAERELDEFKLAVVPRQVLPPGTVRFDLDALRDDDADHAGKFYFQFDRETVLTATLRHRGSDAAMLCFQGGPQQHYWTREDAEHGETLTIAVTLRRAAIYAMAGRYWILDVMNFDRERALSAELTVRYDALEGGAIRPLPSNASFEHFHWFAERLESGNPDARQLATAQALGFDDWKTLRDHVAWSEPQLPQDGAHMRDTYLLQVQAKYGESFGLAELMEFMSAQTKYSEDLRRAMQLAFDRAAAGPSRPSTTSSCAASERLELAQRYLVNRSTKRFDDSSDLALADIERWPDHHDVAHGAGAAGIERNAATVGACHDPVRDLVVDAVAGQRVAVLDDLRTDEEARAAHLGDVRMLGKRLGQLRLQCLAGLGGPFHEALPGEDFQHPVGGGAGGGVRGEGVEHHVHSGFLEGRRHGFGAEYARERRIAARKPLARHQDVRLDAPPIQGEARAGPTEAAHHLVGQEQDVVFVAEGPNRWPVAVGRHQRAAAGADDGFGKEPRDGTRAFLVDPVLEGVQAILADVFGGTAQRIGRRHLRYRRQRVVQAEPPRFVTAHGQGGQRRAVVGGRLGDDLRLFEPPRAAWYSRAILMAVSTPSEPLAVRCIRVKPGGSQSSSKRSISRSRSGVSQGGTT